MKNKMIDGVELRNIDVKGEGVFATRTFKAGEIVVVGIIETILDKNTRHASQIALNKYVLHAGLMAKVNHSCDPNCGIRVNETGGHDIVAMKNISVGEEITYDYAMGNYYIDHFPPKCICGSKECRGRVTGWKDLSATRKKEYQGFVAPYLIELDKREYVTQ